jgi:uncharacterized protein (TIGR02246 family)
MTLNALGRIGFLATAMAIAACAQQPAPAPTTTPDTRAADEATLRTLSKDWSASAQAKDAVKFVSFYADDAAVMLGNAPDIKGLPAIREALTGMMQDPAFALSFETDDVVVARSGELAYETGSYSMTLTGPDKKPATEKGHFVAVWRKQADGTWKVAIDAPISDPPEAPAAVTRN